MSGGRQAAGQPVSVFRECLAGPFHTLRKEALRILREAIEEEPTIAAVCRRLGIPRQSFDRLRGDFPEITTSEEQSAE